MYLDSYFGKKYVIGLKSQKRYTVYVVDPSKPILNFIVIKKLI